MSNPEALEQKIELEDLIREVDYLAMAIFQTLSPILRNNEIARGIFRMRIRSPQIVSSGYPGQFVMLRVRNELNPLLRRPFSFHRFTPGDDEETFEILFKVVGQGTHIMSQLRPGGIIDLLGPLGKGFKMPRREFFGLSKIDMIKLKKLFKNLFYIYLRRGK